MYMYMIMIKKKDLHIFLCNTNLFKKLINMGIWLYNKVPVNIKKLEQV